MAGNVDYGYVAVGNSQRFVSQKSFGGFIQDSWRASTRLTVNAGLRYDLSLPIKERHDLLANFDPAQGMVQVGKQISQPYNTDYKNFAPRLSFDYDVSGTGRTVLRAGAGIIYEIPHISVFIGQNSTQAQGLALIPTGLPLTDINGQPDRLARYDRCDHICTDRFFTNDKLASGRADLRQSLSQCRVLLVCSWHQTLRARYSA